MLNEIVLRKVKDLSDMNADLNNFIRKNHFYNAITPFD